MHFWCILGVFFGFLEKNCQQFSKIKRGVNPCFIRICRYGYRLPEGCHHQCDCYEAPCMCHQYYIVTIIMATRSKEAITDVIVMNLHVPLSLLWRSPSLLGMRPATIDTERQPNMAAVAITIEGIDAIDIAILKYPSTITKFKTHQTCPISTLSCLQFNWSEKINGTVERQQLLLWEISFSKDF